nr:EOG090X0QLW [Moina brachiata]
MKLTMHLALLAVLLTARLASSSIDASVAKQLQQPSVNLKAVDDLYIDDEGDDDIQLADEASGAGPGRVIDEDEDEDEEEEDEEDEEDTVPVVPVVEEKKTTTTSTTTPASVTIASRTPSADYKDDVVAAPKVSPVAAKPASSRDDEDFVVDGSGAGGSGAGPDTDDEDEDEEEDEDDYTDQNVDVPPAITEPPVRPAPEKKPEVVVVAQPTTPSVIKELQPAATTAQPPSHADHVPAEPATATPPVDPNASDVHVIDHKPEDRPAFFAQPGILAAVIGGAVVGLLCAILLVMFIVYRMRKKDEGSYVLDEPKRNSPSANPYNKNSREFYA